MTDRLSL